MLPASIMESISEGYDKLWKELIKPERTVYSVEDLGPLVLSLDAGRYGRRYKFREEGLDDSYQPVQQYRSLVFLPNRDGSSPI